MTYNYELQPYKYEEHFHRKRGMHLLKFRDQSNQNNQDKL